ncbi:non-structural maintenance of chromosomes element 1 [Sarotherodon galilaeus]
MLSDVTVTFDQHNVNIAHVTDWQPVPPCLSPNDSWGRLLPCDPPNLYCGNSICGNCETAVLGSVQPAIQFSLPFSLSASQSFRSCPVHPRFIINHLQFFTIHESCVWVTSSPPHDTNPDRMTRPVPRRHAYDPADSDLFERQDAVLSIWAEKLRWKQRLFSEREHVFEGTRLALGGPRRRRGPPPAASPASEHSPRRVGVTGQGSAARSPAAPLLTRPPAVLLSGSSTSPRHSGYASHLGSTEAPAPEAQLFTTPASSSRRKRRTRRHNMDYFEQLPVPTPTPVPAPRTRAAVTQSTPAPVSVPRVGVTGVQPPPVPVPAPRLRVARVRPDPPRGSAEALQLVPSRSGGSEELICPSASLPPHPPPDPAFHALALSLVRLAELFPAQAPDALAQAAALSPSLAQSIAQPLASPTSVHPLASPVQSVNSPAVQLPAQSVQSPVAQSPVLQSPVAQSPVLQSPPVQSVQSPPVPQSPVLQPVQSVVQSSVVQSVQSVVQSPVAQSPIQSLAQASCELSRSSARGFRTRWPGRSSARGFRTCWPGLSPARGFRTRWPCSGSSVTAGSRAVACSCCSAAVSSSSSDSATFQAADLTSSPRGRPPELYRLSHRPRGRPPELYRLSHWPRGRPPELSLFGLCPSVLGSLRPPCSAASLRCEDLQGGEEDGSKKEEPGYKKKQRQKGKKKETGQGLVVESSVPTNAKTKSTPLVDTYLSGSCSQSLVDEIKGGKGAEQAYVEICRLGHTTILD